MDNALVQRMIGAARLDVATYEEVERDTSATQQALIVVILAAVASGIGALDDGGTGLIGGVIGGDRRMGGACLALLFRRHPLSRFGEHPGRLGSTGANAGVRLHPRYPGILGFIPVVDVVVASIVFVWGIAATIVAIRQALDFSTGRAIATAIISVIISSIVHRASSTPSSGSAAASRHRDRPDGCRSERGPARVAGRLPCRRSARI